MGDFEPTIYKEWHVQEITVTHEPHFSHFKMGTKEFERIKKVVEDMGLPLEDYFQLETPEEAAARVAAAAAKAREDYYSQDNTVGQF